MGVLPSALNDGDAPVTHRLGPVAVLGWVAVLVAACALVLSLFSNTFPLAPGADWQLRQSEARAISLERFTDLGPLPESIYVTLSLERNRRLEAQLLEQEAGADHDLASRLNHWLVVAYPTGASAEQWSHRAELTLRGEVVSLLAGVPPGFSSRVQLTREDAISRADRLLERSGRELASFYDPVERIAETPSYSHHVLRYERRSGSGAPSADEVEPPVRHGVDVQFAGDLLLGFSSWQEFDPDPVLQRNLERVQQLQLLQLLSFFLLLAVIAVVFIRRYHQGLVGAKRGTQIAVILFAAALWSVVASSSSTTEGWSFGGLSRLETTVGWVGLMLIVYLPLLALVGGLSFAVGESLARGAWRQRLSSFDALLSSHWGNATVAASSLRGVASGLVLLAALQLSVQFSGQYGLLAPFTLQLGPGWESTRWPGASLLLTQSVLSIVGLSFALLFLLPLLARRLPLWLAGGMAAMCLGLVLSAPVVTVPAWGCLPGVLLSTVALVWLFVRYDFLVAWLAHIVASVGIGALTLLDSGDPYLRVQGLGVLLCAAAPLWASVRFVSTSKQHEYAYDEVPPHVRRIAERERQRVELETARGIQGSILPTLPNQLRGVEIAYTYRPASEVGGDFYDVIELEDGRLAVAIGDVAGHGVSSGLIMSMVRAAFAVQVRYGPHVEQVIPALNDVVCGSARKRLLTTLCYALLDPQRRRLEFACAGHLHPYRLRPGAGVTALQSTAYPLGVRPKINADRRETSWLPGDTLVFATDGLVEAVRLGGSELFGFERFESSLEGLVGLEPGLVRDGVLQDLEEFLAGGKRRVDQSVTAEDDLTLLVLRLPPDLG